MTDQQHIARTFIQTYPLPEDLVQALAIERQIKTAKGVYTLRAANKLPMISVLVEIELNEQETIEPWAITHYCSTAYVLTIPPPRDKPAHKVLIWIPAVNLYGYYLQAQHSVYVYPQTTVRELNQQLTDDKLPPCPAHSPGFIHL